MFGELYAERRTDVNQGHLETLARLCEWLERGDPFAHLRFADGEFMCITRELPNGDVNGDGSTHFADLGTALGQVLIAMGAAHPDHGQLLVGGDWAGSPTHFNWLREHGLLRTIPWTAGGVFVDGVVSGAILRWLDALRAYPRSIVLVGCDEIRPAARFMRASFVPVPHPNAWLATDETMATLRARAQPGDLVLLCGGQAAKVWGWRLWYDSGRAVSVVDMGHFFDLACGRYTRRWHEECDPPWDNRRRIYEETITPIVRGVLCA
jgi:hypothetical protein